jgi:hypothetical protein
VHYFCHLGKLNESQIMNAISNATELREPYKSPQPKFLTIRFGLSFVYFNKRPATMQVIKMLIIGMKLSSNLNIKTDKNCRANVAIKKNIFI